MVVLPVRAIAPTTPYTDAGFVGLLVKGGGIGMGAGRFYRRPGKVPTAATTL